MLKNAVFKPLFGIHGKRNRQPVFVFLVRLIAETYIIPGNELIPERENCYFHLVGGPEAEKKNGVPKWNVREAYSKYPNSEMELAEFLKSLQKGK